jgi:hypothetical protein
MSNINNPNISASPQPDYTLTGVASFPFMSLTINSGGASASMPANNLVAVLQLVIPGAVTLQNLAVSISGTAQNIDIGFYSLSGNLLVHNPIPSSSGLGVINTSITPYTLVPGVYYYAWTSGGTGCTLYGQGGLDHDLCALFAGMGNVTFTAANAATLGVLPATLGTLTPVNLALSSILPPTMVSMV